MKDSDRCPGTNRNGEPCGHPTGWGTDKDHGPCKHHGGAADNRGKKNGNWRHGAYSEHFKSDLSEREEEAYEDLVGAFEDPEKALGVVREVAAEALLKYKRSGDQRFLTEWRQLADTFNLAPNEDVLDVNQEVDVKTIDEEEKQLLNDLLDRNPQE